MKKSLVAFAVVLTVVGSLSLLGLARSSTPSDSETVATITQIENDAVKADLAADASFYEKYLADDWTGGTSRGTWDSKQSIASDMKDSKNNKTNSREHQRSEGPRSRRCRDCHLQEHLRLVDQRAALRQDRPEHGYVPAGEWRLEAARGPQLAGGQVGTARSSVRGDARNIGTVPGGP